MAQITQDVNVGVPLEEKRRDDEEVGLGNESGNSDEPSHKFGKKKTIIWIFVAIAAIALIVGLSVGLTQRNKDPEESADAIADPSTDPKNTEIIVDDSTAPNPNLEIFDDAFAMLESTPRQEHELASGETMSYREFNTGQPHVLVVLPGFMTDDSMSSLIAVLPQFNDHTIVAVNPIGWNGSTMKKSIYSHEENADQVMELLKTIGVEKAMAMGYSTGGGIAFYMAKKYPEIISAAFLAHSIPLDGFNVMDANGVPMPMDTLEDIEKMVSIYPSDREPLMQMLKSISTNPEGFVPNDHALMDYFYDAAANMPGKVEAMKANVSFNVTPIKTKNAVPNDVLANLKSKVVVLHGSKDTTVSVQQVESVTKLAIVDEWAPQDMISYYDDGEGHMVIFDNPRVFANVYRKAFEEQVLAANGINPNMKIFDDAVVLIESTPRQEQELPSGETMSYREFNKGQPHVLVFLPGFGADDTLTSLIAVLPQFQDHWIIAVNPIGWNGSTMKKSIYSHEENADQVMDLLKLIGVEKAMAMGYSTGGGIAFYMAQKYPDIISTAFLAHSIPLNGMKYPDGLETNEIDTESSIEDIKAMFPVSMFPDDLDILYEMMKSYSSNPAGYPPRNHKINEYGIEAALNMPGQFEATFANIAFNVSPIKTKNAEPSDALVSLKSKVVVIHGSKDFLVSAQQVESVTNLAIAEQWAPAGTLTFYDDEEGHMVMLDNPKAFAAVYRKAFEEQVLA